MRAASRRIAAVCPVLSSRVRRRGPSPGRKPRGNWEGAGKNLQITVKVQGRTATAALSGEFDLTAAQSVRRELDGLIDGGHRRLVVDLRKVPFLDSSGLGVLLGRYRRLSELGGEMFIFGAQQPVRTVLEMSGVPQVVPVLRSESEVPH